MSESNQVKWRGVRPINPAEAIPCRTHYTPPAADCEPNQVKWIGIRPTDPSVAIPIDLPELDVLRDNLAILAFRLSIASSLVLFDLEDGIIDEYEDESGIDTVLSTYEEYDAANDLYKPVVEVVVELDYMEYATNAAAQAAYVSSDPIGSDVCTGGTASASSEAGPSYVAAKAFDDNTGTTHATASGVKAYWLKYDLGVGVTKIVRRYVVDGRNGTEASPDDWTFEGSNNDADWTVLDTQINQKAIVGAVGGGTYSFSNTAAYRYYRLNVSDSGASDYIYIAEMEMIEGNLQCYSEATIKQQGSYSLKGIALITNSLNDTLTRTVSPTINLTGQDSIKFDIYASRTGANIKISIHDSGGTTTEKTYTVLAANTWETVTWDISAVANANKDAIDQIKITIVNADAENTFYIDNMYSGVALTYNMTLISESFEAEAEPTWGRIVFIMEDTDPATINTDIKAWVSLDDGSNYEQVTLTDEGDFATGQKIISGTEELTDLDDKTMRYKLTTHNNKMIKIHATGLMWG